MGRSRTCDIQLYSPTASRSPRAASCAARRTPGTVEPEEGRGRARRRLDREATRCCLASHKMRPAARRRRAALFDESRRDRRRPPIGRGACRAAAEEKGLSRTMLLVGIPVVGAGRGGAAAWLLFLNP